MQRKLVLFGDGIYFLDVLGILCDGVDLIIWKTRKKFSVFFYSKDNSFAGVSVKFMMLGLLMKIESGKLLACWRNLLSVSLMLKK